MSTSRLDPRLQGPVPAAAARNTPKATENVTPSARELKGSSDIFQAGHAHGPSCGCGETVTLDATEKAVQLKMKELLAARASGAPAPGTTGGTIDVHFHVITQGRGIANGDVPPEMIKRQISVLNDAYKETGWQFRLATVDRTTNPRWFAADSNSSAEREMKAALRKGDSDDLNLYTSAPQGNVLGWATFPKNYKSDPVRDGVVILHSSLPGGSKAPYNEGDTATHEVGHWMGLYHTWNQQKTGSTQVSGDFVSDTPAHAKANFGQAPESTDSLPDVPGNDPVHNYMNYGDDNWLTEFTPGQDARMDAQWQLFRERPTSSRS